MHHNHLNRDGVYLQPSLTKVAAAGLHLDTAFRVSFLGEVFGQPLYVDNGPGGTDLVIVATQSDTVYAFDASSGQQVWTQTLGTPVPLADMPCGNIDPLGITGTPVIDFASRTLFVAAMTTPDDGATKQYEIYALSIDDGTVRSGWPIDVASALAGVGATFTASVQSQRAALAIVNGILYVPFGGLGGDCGDYRGWVVAVPLSNPQGLEAWSTGARGGGIWGPGGVASDGTNIFVTTGNTFNPPDWAGGEAVISFPASMPLATTPSYWTPTDWPAMDVNDLDLGSAGPIVFDLPGATPSHLVFALGKHGLGYLEDANALGGVADAVASFQASSTMAIGAHAVYSTATATYIVFRGSGEYCLGATGSTDLATLVVVPGSPPNLTPSWCATATGGGSPIVTTSDGQADTIVWVVGAEFNELLQGFDGDTGATIFAGGNAPILGARRYSSPIAAKGRIFVAGDNMVVAFTP
jgi:outer membrane protein assembly factor BamB